MGTFKKVDFKSLCRFCIKLTPQTLDLFSDEHNELVNQIMDCLSIKVKEEDNLPRKICTSCLDELNKFEKFRLKCIKSVANLECYYSLFKDTIDKDGTIFLKLEDAVINSEDSFSENAKEASSFKTTTNVSAVNVQPVVNDTNINKPIQNYSPVEVFNKPNEIINNISSLADTSQTPYTPSTDDIIVVDINKCDNILDLISPGASIYVVNTNSNEEKVPCGDIPFNDESASKELDKVLNSANLDIANFDPVLDQQGIENISQFLSELCSEEKNNEKQNESNICEFLSPQLGAPEKESHILDSNLFKTSIHTSDVNPLNVEELETNKKSQFIYDDINRNNNFTEIIKNKKETTSIATVADNKESMHFFESEISKNTEQNVSKTSTIQVTELPLPSIKQIEIIQSKVTNFAQNIRKINCPECGKEFDKIKGFNIHRASHFLNNTTPNIEDHLCLICNKKFKTSVQLKIHMTTHKPDRKAVTCTLCDKMFYRKLSLNRHMDSYHYTRDVFSDSNCLICSRESKNKNYLRNHILCQKKFQKPVKQEKQYKCEDCLIICGKKTDFQLHRRIVHSKDSIATISDDEDDTCSSLASNQVNNITSCPVKVNTDSRNIMQAKASEMLDSALSMLENVLPDRCSTPIEPLSPSILDTPRKVISPLNTLSELNTSKLMSMFSSHDKLSAMNFDGFSSESLFQRIQENEFDCNNKDMSNTSFFDLDDLLTETTKSFETDNSAYLLTKNSPEHNPVGLSSERAPCIDECFPLKPLTQHSPSQLSASKNMNSQGPQTLYAESGTTNKSTSSINKCKSNENSLALNHQSSDIESIGEMTCTVFLDNSDTDEIKETMPSYSFSDSKKLNYNQRKRKKSSRTPKSDKIKKINYSNESDHNYFKEVAKSCKPSLYDELVSGKDSNIGFEERNTLTLKKKKSNLNSQQQNSHKKPSRTIKSNTIMAATDSTCNIDIRNLLSKECEAMEQHSTRTINILLDKFNNKSDKTDKEIISNKLLLGQPYNIRESKDIQTYICAMEDP